jgi:ABC-type uncharacterized transport system substrate-binding protein
MICLRCALPALAVSGLLASALPAAAHPHVFVTAEAEVLFEGAQVTGVRHRWTFDEAYSAFATQGLDKNNDGKLDDTELAELAKVNVESLHEFGFFSVLRMNGRKQAFKQPVDYRLTHENKLLTLTLTLPLQVPGPSRTAGLEVADPEFFVSFAWKDGDGVVKAVNAPQGCQVTITRAKALDSLPQEKLTEDFFAQGGAQSLAGQLSNKALIVCP